VLRFFAERARPGLTSVAIAWHLNYRTGKEGLVTQITARLPDELVAALDGAASQLRRTRADVVRQAIEYYLDDFEDVAAAIQALQDPADPVLDWESVRRDLLGQD
jgi:RHH-type transcriptional regulator, rel operon repressor / antitoxin RelB